MTCSWFWDVVIFIRQTENRLWPTLSPQIDSGTRLNRLNKLNSCVWGLNHGIAGQPSTRLFFSLLRVGWAGVHVRSNCTLKRCKNVSLIHLNITKSLLKGVLNLDPYSIGILDPHPCETNADPSYCSPPTHLFCSFARSRYLWESLVSCATVALNYIFFVIHVHLLCHSCTNSEPMYLLKNFVNKK